MEPGSEAESRSFSSADSSAQGEYGPIGATELPAAGVKAINTRPSAYPGT